MIHYDKIRLIAFDADDTLWDCQTFYDRAVEIYCDILAPYGVTSDNANNALFAVETKNMPLLGYGCKAFILSLIENALAITNYQISGRDIQRILELSEKLLTSLGTPLKDVYQTMEKLQKKSSITRVVFTKGELLDQKNKFQRSGLAPFFDDIIIVEDKTEAAYCELCHRYNINISDFLMVGNSFRSDIEPVLKLGGNAIHIPFHAVWQHEITEEYNHERLEKLKNFTELADLLP